MRDAVVYRKCIRERAEEEAERDAGVCASVCGIEKQRGQEGARTFIREREAEGVEEGAGAKERGGRLLCCV